MEGKPENDQIEGFENKKSSNIGLGKLNLRDDNDPVNEQRNLAEKNEFLQSQLRALKEELACSRDDQAETTMDKIDGESIKQGRDKFNTLGVVREIDPVNERLTLAEKNKFVQSELRSLEEELALTRDDKTETIHKENVKQSRQSLQVVRKRNTKRLVDQFESEHGLFWHQNCIPIPEPIPEHGLFWHQKCIPIPVLDLTTELRELNLEIIANDSRCSSSSYSSSSSILYLPPSISADTGIVPNAPDSGIVPDAPDSGAKPRRPLSKVERTEDVQADNIEALRLELRQQRLDIAHGGTRTPSSYNLPISADWRWPHAYQIFKIPPHTTCFVLNGAMKISCQEKSMTVKARFCPLDEFDEVATTLRKQKKVNIQSEMIWPW